MRGWADGSKGKEIWTQGRRTETTPTEPVLQGEESRNKMLFDLNEVPQEETDTVEDNELHRL